MYKNYLNVLCLAGATFALASCSDDAQGLNGSTGNEATVSFVVSVPEVAASRSIDQGDYAKNLTVAVFDKNGNFVYQQDRGDVFATGKTQNVKVQLISGETYTVAFWVESDNNPYTITKGVLSIDYSNVNANCDEYDAFYAARSIEVKSENLTQSISLIRPFAQVNLGTDDYDFVTTTMGVNPTQTTATIKGCAYTSMNLLNGNVLGDVADVTFKLAKMPDYDINSAPINLNEDYTWIGMNYVLCDKGGGTISEITFSTDDDRLGTYSYAKGAPVKRNMRTNLTGSLFTDTSDWTVTIDYVMASAWDGTTLSMPTIDTSAKTVTVDTPSELAGLAALVNGTYPGESANNFEGYTLKLDNDVDLGDKEWAPIGNGSRSGSGTSGQVFSGTFDGQGHTISGLKIETTPGEDAGIALFGIVSGGEVKNLNFEDVDINVPTSEMAAAAVGLLTDGGTVSGITVSGNIVAKRGVGAVVGRITIDGTVTDCVNNAAIKATGANAGGIVGAAYYTKEGKTMTISNCENHGVLTSTAGDIGGIVGLSAADVSNCTNYAPITGGAACVAGIVGEQQNAGSVKNCENKADIKNTTSTYGTGGIVGWIRYTGTVANYASKNIIEVTGCTNEGSVSGGNDAGGIVGTVYNLGNIHHNVNKAPSLSATTFAAGIVGNAQFTEATPGLSDPNKVEVKNNVSTTPIENITGGCKALYVYKNDPSSVEDENNTQTLN